MSGKTTPFHANGLLPATLSADYTHTLCVRWGNTKTLARMYAFTSYDAALAAYEAVIAYNVEQEEKAGATYSPDEIRSHFAVRSIEDPNVATNSVSDATLQVLAPTFVVGRAVREMERKEIGETASWALRRAKALAEHGIEQTWSGVEKIMRDSLDSRGIGYDRFDITDALKRRVTIGRRGNERMGYFFAKNTGAQLRYVRCPKTGVRLNATTLALAAPFVFIPNPIATYFETKADLLPGETPKDRDARWDRVDAVRQEDEEFYANQRRY